MQTKQIDLMVKEAPGEVPGIIAYASTFDRIPDAYGDVVAKGAFAGTLKRLEESGTNLPLLYGHVMDKPENIIGTVTKATEDDHGLLVEATFDMENPNAQQVRRAVLSKAITKLSFAFSVLDQHTIDLEGYGEVNELTELEIYEVSLVVVPANPRAQVVEAKDAEPELKSDGCEAADDTEPETEPEEVKAEEPMEAKAEEPEKKAEEEEENINPVSEKEQTMDIETMNAIAGAEPAEKSLVEIATETFVGKKEGSRFNLATPEIKAATWMGTPAIQEITREVPALKKPLGIADAFSTVVLSSGNTYTYVPVTPKDGAFAPVAEGATKTLVDYNKTPVAVPLTKYAGTMKFSDEIMEDAEWLVSEITGQGEWDLERAMDAAAWAALDGASGIGSFTATTDMVNDAIKAAAQAYAASGYMADVIFMNPVDFAAAKVASRSLPGEAYISADGIDRLTVIESDQVTAGTAIVGNSQFAKRALKGGRRVEATNSNDTDFEHNLVTVRVEQRAAFAITLPQAFVKIA